MSAAPALPPTQYRHGSTEEDYISRLMNKIHRMREGYACKLKGGGYLNANKPPLMGDPLEVAYAAAKKGHDQATAATAEAVEAVATAKASNAPQDEVTQLEIKEARVSGGLAIVCSVPKAANGVQPT